MKTKYLRYIFQKDNVLPIHLIFQITYWCNAECKSCFVFINQNTDRELDINEIRKLGANFQHLVWMQLGGGEPFLRKDLPEICASFPVDHLSIPTNATLTEKIYRDLETILKNQPLDLLHLSISLDGIGEKHDELRGFKDNFKRVQETYQRVQSLRKKYPQFSVSVNTVISKSNEDEIEPIAAYVANHMNVDYHAFEFLRGSPKERNMSLPSDDKIEKLIQVIKKSITAHGFYKGLGIAAKFTQAAKLLTQDIVQGVLDTNKRHIPCYAGRLSTMIDPYGRVHPCELLEDEWGKLREVDFDLKKIWFSNQWQERRKFIHDECFCTHSCFMLPNILFNPTLYPRLLKYLIALKNTAARSVPTPPSGDLSHVHVSPQPSQS